MKNLALIVILFAVFTGPLLAAEKGMNETGKAFVKAFEANDLEAVMALYAPDARVFPPDAMEAVGSAAIRANYGGLMNTFTIQKLTIVNAEYETHGDISFGWGRYTLDMVPKAGGEPVHMEGRFSDVSKKISGKWQYVVDHASVPFTPPPGKPATK